MNPTNHLKVALQACKDTLTESDALADCLVEVWDFWSFNYSGYTVLPGRLTISLIPGDSTQGTPRHNEPSQSDILETEFILTCDTHVWDDDHVFLSDEEITLIDFEYMVIRALQERDNWNVPKSFDGWDVSSIERDIAVEDASGDIDLDIRRFQITLTVDVYMDRTDGPAR